MGSAIADLVYTILKKRFPLGTIKKEHYVYYKGTKLFFDFYLKDLNVLIEVQGQQHTTFVKHFHNSREAFIGQKKRDNLKVEYIQNNPDYALAIFHYNEKITEDLVMEKIFKAISKGV